MVLLCGASAVSAASDNAVDNLTSDMDDSFLVSNNLNAVGVDESASVAQENDDGLLGQSPINEFNELDNEILGEDSTDESASDEGYVIYVGTHNKTETGNGSYENPFSTLKLACDNVSGQDTVTVKVFNGTYYMGSHLRFNTTNLNIEGITGKVIVTYLYDSDDMVVLMMHFGGLKYIIS